MASELNIPHTEADLTPAWVNQVTGHSAVQEDFHIEDNIQTGNGFLSSIFRVAYKTKNGESHQIIIKLLPDDPKWLEFALVDESDEREINFYSIILPDLLEVVPEIQENVCKFYNGTVKKEDLVKGTTKSSMLIMEDLKPLGFEMMNFAGESSEDTIRSLVRFAAHLHFGAFAVEAKKGIPLPQLYPFMQGITDDESWFDQIDSLCEAGYKLLENLLATHKIPGKVWEDFEKLKPYTSIIARKITAAGRIHPCLVHTDIWPPNIQVHESLPVKVLDWQLLGYRDVTFDLHVMLYTILPREELTKENLTRLLRLYYDEFEQLCKDRGFDDRIKRRTWEEFEEFFFTWAGAFGFMVYLPSIECYGKNLAKYANIFRVLSELNHVPEFLLKVCTSQ